MESVCTAVSINKKFYKSRSLQSLTTFFRITFTLILVLALFAPHSHAAQTTLAWNAPTTYIDGTPLNNLSGYKLYLGTASGSYSQNVDVGNTTSYNVSSLNDGTTYYFAVKAYDASGNMSGYSNQVTYTTAALPPPTTSYTLTASAGSGGTITPSGAIAITQGLNQSFSIVPSTGYKIAGVTVDGASVGAVSSYTFSNVTANHSISATFSANSVASYTISASAGTGGVISPAGSTTVNSGGSKTYTITPNTGYTITSVTVDGASVGAISTYTFSNVTANHSISATFSATNASSYTISATAGTGGAISPAGITTVRSGRSKTYTITPNTGYKITGVTVDGASFGAISSYRFSNVNANHTISATFASTTITPTPITPTPIAFKQVAASTPQAPTQTVSVTYPGSQTVGNLNIVVVGWNDTTATVQSVADSAGNVYNLAIGPTSGTGLRQSIYYAKNIKGGNSTVTVTFSNPANYPDIRVLEYTGVTTLDVTAGASGSGSTASSGSASTTAANELIFGANTVATGTNGPGSGFTNRMITSPDGDIAEDTIVSATGTYSVSAPLDSAGNWVMQMATFK